jgi:hypothetical protein
VQPARQILPHASNPSNHEGLTKAVLPSVPRIGRPDLAASVEKPAEALDGSRRLAPVLNSKYIPRPDV